MNITWDPHKGAVNVRKHGVAFSDAETVLSDPMAITIEDRSHGEQRFLTIGMNLTGRMLVVAYAYAAEDAIRLISARKATQRERKSYDKKR